MDEENQINDKLKIIRELTNARAKKYSKKKCTECQQLNSSMKDDPAEETQNKHPTFFYQNLVDFNKVRLHEVTLTFICMRQFFPPVNSVS